ncbi:MAG: hypothetical protein J5865_08750 [Lachnospiraceae bacterium]|nr:hypothetical protein [Lachnospiraceae bacterium]
MAKDDYSVIVLKILGYLYGCLKNGVSVSREDLSPYSMLFRVRGEAINEQYWYNILRMLTEEGLITGLIFKTVWGKEIVCISDIEDCKITPEGIHYLETHDSMKKAWQVLIETKDIMVTMLAKILPF